ncbi:hypothetical protein [uncultured Chitinophaga sp.]|uniref:hypothetical protein n=1 Tax=uncultured Chitinophaga sp. TaxID=339340 RepID=UPI0025D04EBD|nr:hypothetical protein [uncultured Chitinophaga sp.]
MVFEYVSTGRVKIDEIAFEFGDSRERVRAIIGSIYTEDNQTIQIGATEDDIIHQRRDIYSNINSSENYFFLSYDMQDLLSEVEVHFCDSIKVFESQFEFDDDFESVKSKLILYSPVIIRNEGECFFNNLKVVIMSKEQMGGEGTTLGYFYCAADVTHLD